MRDESGLLDAADCVENVSKGFKKDTGCIAKFFIPQMRLDPDKKCVVTFLSPLQYFASTS